MSEHFLTVPDALKIIERVDAHLDSAASPQYQSQPLAQHWARVTKVCEEAGEVWQEWSRFSGENPRKGECGSMEEVLAELGDTASAAIFAIQHLTKDPDKTWEVISAALLKANGRIS
jgi:NTP pyrophosphatase (non-canonical NTP hydrolase)